MIIYLLLFGFVFISYLFFPNNKKIAGFWLVIMFLLLAFRADSVGTDTANYLDVGTKYEYDARLSQNVEIAFSSLEDFIVEYNLSPRILLVVMAFVTIFFLYLSLSKLGHSYMLGVLLFLILFYFSSFNISRQLCACSVVLYAFTFLFENSKQKYLFFVFVLFAMTIHLSSGLFVFLYFLRNVKPKISKTVLVAIAVVLYVINTIAPFNFSELTILLSSNLLSYADLYSDLAITQNRSFVGFAVDTLEFIAIIWIFVYGANSRASSSDIIFYLFILATILGNNTHSVIARLFLPLAMYQIIYITDLYQNGKLRKDSVPLIFYLMFNTFWALYGAASGSGEIVPYRFVSF